MPRMKPIEPWYSLYRQVDQALRTQAKRAYPDMTPEGIDQARLARDALWGLAHNREGNEFAVETLRDVLDEQRS